MSQMRQPKTSVCKAPFLHDNLLTTNSPTRYQRHYAPEQQPSYDYVKALRKRGDEVPEFQVRTMHHQFRIPQIVNQGEFEQFELQLKQLNLMYGSTARASKYQLQNRKRHATTPDVAQFAAVEKPQTAPPAQKYQELPCKAPSPYGIARYFQQPQKAPLLCPVPRQEKVSILSNAKTVSQIREQLLKSFKPKEVVAQTELRIFDEQSDDLFLHYGL